jgi:hypothetical protein
VDRIVASRNLIPKRGNGSTFKSYPDRTLEHTQAESYIRLREQLSEQTSAMDVAGLIALSVDGRIIAAMD